MTIENKDWKRMSDLIVDGKDGAGVARSIKSKEKAIARYVAALRLLKEEPLSNFNNGRFTGSFCDFGNKALELGSSIDEISKVWSACPEPTGMINEISEYFDTVKNRVRIPDNFFKTLRNKNIPIATSEPKRSAGPEAQDAMRSNGRKWNIPLDIVFYPDTYDEMRVSLDVITDEGGDSNKYALYSENGIETGLSGVFGYNELSQHIFDALGISGQLG